MTIDIIFNSKKEQIGGEITLSDLLKERNIKKETVTVELNSQIVDKNKYDDVKIKNGDKLEFVYYMGGGSVSCNREALDLRQTSCPLNFVKAKLKLEEMNEGVLEILLNEESCGNVAGSIKDEGYKILYLKPQEEHYLLGIEAKKKQEKKNGNTE